MRTTAAKVKEIIETDLEDAIVDAYIKGATELVSATLSGKGLGADLLEEIERWVAAHLMAATRERQAIREEAGGAKVQYQGEFSTGLNLTSYGQIAIALDTSGGLAALGVKRVTIKAVAT